MNYLDNLVANAKAAFNAATTVAELDSAKVLHLTHGEDAPITQIRRELKDVPWWIRDVAGKLHNEARTEIQAAYDKRRVELSTPDQLKSPVVYSVSKDSAVASMGSRLSINGMSYEDLVAKNRALKDRLAELDDKIDGIRFKTALSLHSSNGYDNQGVNTAELYYRLLALEAKMNYIFKQDWPTV